MLTPETPAYALEEVMRRVSSRDVLQALSKDTLSDNDVAVLLSPAASEHLELIAQRSAALTRRRFGRTMQLYAPIYLSNECVNHCAYCGFSQELPIARRTLSLEEVDAEADILRAQGFRHLLLVAGESPRTVTLAYLERIAHRLGGRFDSLSIETAPFDESGYRRLGDAGIDGVALYQETYLADVYQRVHLAGPKCNPQRRRRAIEDAGKAGMRGLGVGALLGLGPVRIEAFHLAMHARALTKQFWRSRVAVSFPRIRAAAGDYCPAHPVSDADLVQMLCVMRLALPDAELVLSTREPAALRDHLVQLGITRMSAGSTTNPGGYSDVHGSAEQFAVDDQRSAAEVALMLDRQGIEPVWKDFDRAFVSGAKPGL